MGIEERFICSECATLFNDDNPLIGNALFCPKCGGRLETASQREPNSQNEATKGSWFAKIETKEDALKVIKNTSIGFFVVAGIHGVSGFFLTPALFIDAVLIAVLAYILMQWKVRTAAVILLILACIITITTFLNRAGGISKSNSSILLALIILWAGVRATEATFKLRGKFAKEGIST